MKSLVQQELIKRGILWSGFHNMCYSHTEADLDYTLEAVSYTHLRAHETVLDLVCRLLLEKKKNKQKQKTNLHFMNLDTTNRENKVR